MQPKDVPGREQRWLPWVSRGVAKEAKRGLMAYPCLGAQSPSSPRGCKLKTAGGSCSGVAAPGSATISPRRLVQDIQRPLQLASLERNHGFDILSAWLSVMSCLTRCPHVQTSVSSRRRLPPLWSAPRRPPKCCCHRVLWHLLLPLPAGEPSSSRFLFFTMECLDTVSRSQNHCSQIGFIRGVSSN